MLNVYNEFKKLNLNLGEYYKYVPESVEFTVHENYSVKSKNEIDRLKQKFGQYVFSDILDKNRIALLTRYNSNLDGLSILYENDVRNNEILGSTFMLKFDSDSLLSILFSIITNDFILNSCIHGYGLYKTETLYNFDEELKEKYSQDKEIFQKLYDKKYSEIASGLINIFGLIFKGQMYNTALFSKYHIIKWQMTLINEGYVLDEIEQIFSHIYYGLVCPSTFKGDFNNRKLWNCIDDIIDTIVDEQNKNFMDSDSILEIYRLGYNFSEESKEYIKILLDKNIFNEDFPYEINEFLTGYYTVDQLYNNLEFKISKNTLKELYKLEKID